MSNKKDYFWVSQEVFENEIMKKPPLYLRVWFYVSAELSEIRKDRKELEKHIDEIQDACSWYERNKKVVPTKEEIQRILDWIVTLEGDVRYDD